MSKLITTEVINHVLHIEFNRQDKKNALTTDMYRALSYELASAKRNEDVRVAFFKGSEGCFSAGNDIADFLEQPVLDEGSPILNFLHELANFDKPIVAAASGPAVGIGTTLLLHCDLVYATEKTYFCLPFVDLGLCPEAGSSYLLPRQLGYVRAAELLLLAEPFDGNRAKELGIINDVASPDEYIQVAQEKAEKLAMKPVHALRVSRQLIRSNSGFVSKAIEREARSFSELLGSDEAKAIFKKFLEK
ncbi:enoyl-CoA hydratase [Kangiella sediminilitoris]|uniref:Enoyl-CoA hydratase n=1 Tax=Kangiella sediminilitoris TaxID=1144748 RepID=A0A1B3BC55_9GAMM|nr:enoyl-CoA hydratase [Kangiella sediminilitoris]AOE50389.1 enoyl-CoA hydratase [Kangiella sediminilitoris]